MGKGGPGRAVRGHIAQILHTFMFMCYYWKPRDSCGTSAGMGVLEMGLEYLLFGLRRLLCRSYSCHTKKLKTNPAQLHKHYCHRASHHECSLHD